MKRTVLRNAIKTLGKAMNQLDELLETDLDTVGDVDTLGNSRTFSEEENFKLPLPRLELRTYSRASGLLVVQYIVTRQYSGSIFATCHNTCEVDGGKVNDGKPYEPRRMAADIRYDAVNLKLPAYAVHENGNITELTSFREYFGMSDTTEIRYIGEK